MHIQDHSSISYSKEIALEVSDNTSSDDPKAPMNSKAKRINKNDTLLWSFAWGPPV